MLKVLTRIGVATALGAVSVATIANVFATSPIIPVDRSKYPQFNAIGLVERNHEIAELVKRDGNAENADWGTALFIGPCSVLTNYHVSFGEETVLNPKKDYSLRLYVGFAANKPFDTTTDLKPMVKGDLNTNDFVILNDHNCNGLKYGWYDPSPFTVDQLIAMHARVIAVWAYGKAKRGEIGMSAGHVIGIDPRTGNVLTDASTVPGSSGGPIFFTYNGRVLLQGLNVGAASDEYLEDKKVSLENANEFLNLDSIFPRFDYRAYLQRDRHKHPQQNPLRSVLDLQHLPLKTCIKLQAEKVDGLDEENVCA